VTAQRKQAIGIACIIGAVAASLIAFGIIRVWPYDTSASYRAYVNGHASGGVRSGEIIVSQNNSAVSLLIVPLLVTGASLVRASRMDDEARAAASFKLPAAAIVGAVGALIAYVAFFAQFVEEGDLWLGNPLVVMWLSAIMMVAVYGLMKLPSASAPSTSQTLRQGQVGGLVIVGLLTAFVLALMTWGVIDGFVALGVAIAVSVLMLAMTAAIGVVLIRGQHPH
jgi:hypothetical protein